MFPQSKRPNFVKARKYSQGEGWVVRNIVRIARWAHLSKVIASAKKEGQEILGVREFHHG